MGPIHTRKPSGSGGVRKSRLVTGEARYQAAIDGRYIGTFDTRAEAERAIREERVARARDTTVERAVEG